MLFSERYLNNQSLTVEEILMSKYIKMNCLLEKLSQGIKVDFFKLE